MFDVAKYLRRIGVDPQTGPPTLELLAQLQLAHLVHVPFENLHVYHHRQPRTDVDWSYRKIVDERRGGWCFEVNGAFNALLHAVGFGATPASCQVWEADVGRWGVPFDHLASIVHLHGTRWFVDVGFGDCCLEPLELADIERHAVPRRVRTELEQSCDGEHFLLHELMPADEGSPPRWEPQLRVSVQPRTLDEFTPRSTYLKTHPGLSWQEKAFATRAVDGTGSRITLRTALLRRRVGTSAMVDEEVPSAEWSGVLLEHFGLIDTLTRLA